MVGRLTGKRNNDIPGQCSESRERMAERQTNTTTGQKREKQRRKEKETEGGRRERGDYGARCFIVRSAQLASTRPIPNRSTSLRVICLY